MAIVALSDIQTENYFELLILATSDNFSVPMNISNIAP